MVVILAPASVSLEFIARLAKAGIIVSLGHSDANRRGSQSVFDAGRRERRHSSL
jgi:N-acetylglucosamine-6-phosphate deacetylase